MVQNSWRHSLACKELQQLQWEGSCWRLSMRLQNAPAKSDEVWLLTDSGTQQQLEGLCTLGSRQEGKLRAGSGIHEQHFANCPSPRGKFLHPKPCVAPLNPSAQCHPSKPSAAGQIAPGNPQGHIQSAPHHRVSVPARAICRGHWVWNDLWLIDFTDPPQIISPSLGSISPLSPDGCAGSTWRRCSFLITSSGVC